MESKKVNRKKALLAASVAGLLMAANSAFTAQSAFAADVPCYGVNKCKGMGDCGGKGFSCAGKNECKGQGFVNADSKEACLAMEGGRLTAEAPSAEAPVVPAAS